ncbi:MAG: hypothetical protein ABSG53_09765 [Thermoguttaceae bacterium]|jgi:hypothetical protein
MFVEEFGGKFTKGIRNLESGCRRSPTSVIDSGQRFDHESVRHVGLGRPWQRTQKAHCDPE